MGKWIKNHGAFIEENATVKKHQLLIHSVDEYQNSYALRSQTKKECIILILFTWNWFKTGKTNVSVTEVRIVFISGECNDWEKA